MTTSSPTRGQGTLSWVLLSFSLGTLCLAAADDSALVKKLFDQPPREYASAPLWVWNDQLTDRQVIETMRDLAGQQVKQVFVHPRPGLMTPYLSADWFRLWKVALREAKRLDMNVWIYDENSYPSGFAGGWVPELMPEARGRGLDLKEAKTPPAWTTNLLAVLRLDGERVENISAAVKAGDQLPEGRYVVASMLRARNSPWHGDRCYVDLLYPGVTEKFIEVTLEAYRREIGDEFGRRVPGVFTDEPNIRPAGGLPWTADLPDQFQQRWGYSLLDNLASLTLQVGDWKRVRHDYYSLLNTLFIERWGKPFYEWCERHHLQFTGHYWDHEWPHCVGVPDNMAMAAWQHRPGIDCLMNQYAENTFAQFGNVRFCREVSSIANQLGRQRTLVELYGAGGWDLRFEDMKRIGDWLQVLGINFFDEHLSYITLRGARKRDHPQSFSYHEPWWEAYHVSATYFARLTAALSHGEQVNPLLVLEPTTTAWMYQGVEPKLRELGDAFFRLLLALEGAQVEYDLGCEDVLARHGSVQGNQLKVGRRTYAQVVIPPLAENLDRSTQRLLAAFRQAGGRVYSFPGAREQRVEGVLDPAMTQQLPAGGAPADPLADLIKDHALTPEGERVFGRDPSFSIQRTAGDQGILFHHRRQLEDGQLVFLVNTSREHPARGQLITALPGVERWDLNSGKPAPYAFARTGPSSRADFDLPPSGSLLLFLSQAPREPAPAVRLSPVAVAAGSGGLTVKRLEPNVLTLDYVDITAGGETRTNVYYYQAGQFAFQKNGMPRNPWDSAVQFKDELITKTFPPDSGFQASYRFTLAQAVPPNLAIVIERPDLYTIACNGAKVITPKNIWWLDKSFGRIDLTAAARVGENVVTLKATPFTIYHEVEPAYLLGDFTLLGTKRGFAVAPGQPLALGRWNEQGHPFYSGGVAYQQTFRVTKPAGRYVVSLPGWYGSVAKVLVNNRPAGYVTAPPWECDVTSALKRGENRVEVVVIGTLKNLLGPHHGNPGLGLAWPGMFQQGPPSGPPPGTNYHTVGYGLFEPFRLTHLP